MSEQLKVGDIQITWLNGGVTNLDGGAMFGVVPKVLWSKKYPADSNNLIELRTDPLLLQIDGKNILIEAGIGNGRFSDKQIRNFGIKEESKVEQDLQALGLTTKDIDIVLMTHLHYDHVSGLVKSENNCLVPVFENAIIYTSEIEWNEMKSPNIRSRNTYWEQNWKPIEEKVHTYSGELEVLPGLKMIHTGGHSEGHSIIFIERNGEKMIHMADIMPTHAHNNVLWVLAYDDYPMTSIEAKSKWLTNGVKEEVWFTFYHDYKYRAIKWDNTGQVIDCVQREIKK